MAPRTHGADIICRQTFQPKTTIRNRVSSVGAGRCWSGRRRPLAETLFRGDDCVRFTAGEFVYNLCPPCAPVRPGQSALPRTQPKIYTLKSIGHQNVFENTFSRHCERLENLSFRDTAFETPLASRMLARDDGFRRQVVVTWRGKALGSLALEANQQVPRRIWQMREELVPRRNDSCHRVGCG